MRSVFGYRGVHIRNSAYIPLIWKNIRNVDMNELYAMQEQEILR